MSSQPKILGNSDLKSDLQLQEYKDVMCYTNDVMECTENLFYRAAIARVYNKIFKPKSDEKMVPIVHLLDLLSKDSTMVNWSESSGLPWCDMGYESKGQIRDDPEAVTQVRKFWHLLKDGEDTNFPDCLVYTQSDKTKAATTAWTYPATVNFGEAAFTVGLVKEFSEQGRLSAMAYEYISSVDGHERLCNRFQQKNRFFVKLNFHENTVPAWIIKKAFCMLEICINFCKYSESGVPDARKMIRMIKHIENYFINTTVRLPNGTRILKSSGIPKGSNFTLLIGSVVSLIILEHLSLQIDGNHTEDQVAHGNESIARISSYWDINLCHEILKRDFGMTLNLPKCQISKNIKCIHFFRDN